MVIHIELHHCDNRGEFGDKRVQHPKLVHPVQGAFRVAVFQQQVQEQLIGPGVVSQAGVDQMHIGRQQAHRVGMQQGAKAQCFFEYSQNVQRTCEKSIIISDGQPVLPDLIGKTGGFLAGQQPGQHRFRLHMGGFLRGQKDSGQLAHPGGMPEISLHEMFNRPPPAAIGVPHPGGHLDLHVKG